MGALSDLSARRRQAEIMDRPDLEVERHRQALDGLARLNAWSSSARIVWRPLRRLAWELGRDALGEPTARPLRVLDVACGSGDVTLDLWRRARRAEVKLRLFGLDQSPVALERARERARGMGADVEFLEGDALDETTRTHAGGDWDAIVCSTFLHHLDEDEAVALLRGLGDRARRMLLVNDLERSRAGWALAVAACRALTSSDVVHVDGPRSVEGAFTRDEVRALAERAGLVTTDKGALGGGRVHTPVTGVAEVRVEARFPFRWLLTVRKRA